MGKRTNILFISTDQQHWTAMGYLNPEVKTPNLDRLVEQGTTFHRAYTVNPTCTPTRASWITGLYPSQHGAYSLGTKLMEDVPTVGDVFREHGYRTALVGKAHFQPLKDRRRSTRRWSPIPSCMTWISGATSTVPSTVSSTSSWRATTPTNPTSASTTRCGWRRRATRTGATTSCPRPNSWIPTMTASQTPPRPRSPRATAWDIPEEIHYNTWIAERTNALMEHFKENDENFFLWASFFDPHPAYMVPEPYASMYDPDTVTVPEHHRRASSTTSRPTSSCAPAREPRISALSRSRTATAFTAPAPTCAPAKRRPRTSRPCTA